MGTYSCVFIFGFGILQRMDWTHPCRENGTVFSIEDYDCIGFDLDNTLGMYKIGAMIDMEYEILANFMVRKGYSALHLLKPVDHDFLLRGLILDLKNGNLLKVSSTGFILSGSHGTKFLSEKEISEYYPNRHWEVLNGIIQDPMTLYTKSVGERAKAILDYYDVVVAMVYARIIDSTYDKTTDCPKNRSDIYPHIYEGLLYMFNKKHFQTKVGEYFPAMQNNPEKYYYKCNPTVIKWLKSLKNKGKILFLITGSYFDFASLTASYTMGEEWKSYFDIVITYAQKPDFFTKREPFIEVNGSEEKSAIPWKNLKIGGMYAHGNWEELSSFLKLHIKKDHPKFLFIGDHVIQDIYAPRIYTKCDTIAVCEELASEGFEEHSRNHSEEHALTSSLWGSYFYSKKYDMVTIWHDLMKRFAKLCIPNLQVLTDKSA